MSCKYMKFKDNFGLINSFVVHYCGYFDENWNFECQWSVKQNIPGINVPLKCKSRTSIDDDS